MQGNPVVLYITLGFMLVFFFIWLWQSITNRRKLEDDLERRKEELDNQDGEASEGQNAGRKSN